MRVVWVTIACLGSSSGSTISWAQTHSPTPATEPDLGASALLKPTGSQEIWGIWSLRPSGSSGYLGQSQFLFADELSASGEPFFSSQQARQQTIRFLITAMRGQLNSDELRIVRVDPVGSGFAVDVQQIYGDLPIHKARATVFSTATGVHYANINLVPRPRTLVSINHTDFMTPEDAQRLSVDRIRSIAKDAEVLEEPGLVVMRTAADSLPFSEHFAYRTMIRSFSPIAEWSVFIDATNGEILGHEKISTDAVEGVVRIRVEDRCEGGATSVVEMPHMQWSPGLFTGDNGQFSDPSDLNEATLAFQSPYFEITECLQTSNGRCSNDVPLSFEETVPLNPGGYDEIEILDAPLEQADPFYFLHVSRAWMRARLESQNSQFAWTETQVPVWIGLTGQCNAFYSPAQSRLAFFQTIPGSCLNSGRASSVVHHEYGHGIHHHSTGQFDGQVSEGISDFVAATITNDSRLLGLRSCANGLRDTNNTRTYCLSGCDNGPGSPVHDAGWVISGALWDFRSQMIDRYGFDLGVQTTDAIFLRFLNFSGDMFSTYDAMIAADDDNDNDPSNGTLHSCEINRAFADPAPGGVVRFPDLQPQIPGLPSVTFEHDAPGHVTLESGEAPFLEVAVAQDPGCAATGSETLSEVTVFYRVDGGLEQSEVMPRVGGSEELGEYRKVFEQITTPATIEYYFQVSLGDDTFIYPYQGQAPRALGWPFYRQTARFASDETIYFSDFEADDGGLIPSVVGESAQDSDWEWGEPTNLGGDPTEAVSGTKIWGTDLGIAGDGLYGFRRTTYLELPPIDARQLSEVRLQFWRRLLNADQVKVEVNGQEAFENHATFFYWRDPVWTFQDIDLTSFAAGRDNVRIRFVMSDVYNKIDDPQGQTPELGGWNIDDLRVAGITGSGENLEPTPEDPELAEDLGPFLGCRSSPASLSFGGWGLWAIAMWRRKRRRHAWSPR